MSPLAVISATLLLGTSCGWTVTKDAPTYEELAAEDQSIVDRILANASQFHDAMVARGGPGITNVLNREAVQVHFSGLVVAANFGDGYLRVSIWEKLLDSQQDLLADWWLVDLETAQTVYPNIFYDYLATTLAAQQWIYEAQGVTEVYARRPRFNVERDAQRLTVKFFDEAQPAPNAMEVLSAMCIAMRAQYEESFASHYNEDYFAEHILEIADPEEPTEYFYFLCRWLEDARAHRYSLMEEMRLVFARCQMWDTGCAATNASLSP